ncbi:MAG: hypothetical protein V2I33_10330 [Kangiellaceae bacterium]|jgi:hypothetical protein|nr:hypothetical protein [Kangiellaceae bacterium]
MVGVLLMIIGMLLLPDGIAKILVISLLAGALLLWIFKPQMLMAWLFKHDTSYLSEQA